MTRRFDFDGVLAQLQAWLGQDVHVRLEARAGPTSGLAWLNGQLAAGQQLYQPADDEHYIFRIGNNAELAINRGFFEDATLTGDTLELVDESFLISITRQTERATPPLEQ